MTENALKNMTVLVTRPEHQAEPFCDLVTNAGGTAIRFPVIEIKEIPLSEEARQFLQQDTDCMIFISANAVRLGVAAIRAAASERLEQSRVMAIGKATARQLEAEGITPDLVPPSPYNSEALLALPEMQNITDRKYTVVKGMGGRTYLMDQLRQRGGQVNEIDIYVRVKPDINNAVLNKFRQSERAVVSITSVKGLHYLFELAPVEQVDWLKQQVEFLVPGDRVADAVRDLHVKHSPIIAENATDTVMFERLIKSV